MIRARGIKKLIVGCYHEPMCLRITEMDDDTLKEWKIDRDNLDEDCLIDESDIDSDVDDYKTEDEDSEVSEDEQISQ
jgi:hypothetical protein